MKRPSVLQTGFYWIQLPDGTWSIGELDSSFSGTHPWHLLRDEGIYTTDQLEKEGIQEIGGYIGTRPQPRPGKQEYPAVLTKENFWNEIQDRYPGGFHEFVIWIDEYKKKVGWEKLFFPDALEDGTLVYTNIKFHDLPTAMQVGIFIQYWMETGHRYDFFPDGPYTMADLVAAITEAIAEEKAEAHTQKMNDKYDR